MVVKNARLESKEVIIWVSKLRNGTDTVFKLANGDVKMLNLCELDWKQIMVELDRIVMMHYPNLITVKSDDTMLADFIYELGRLSRRQWNIFEISPLVCVDKSVKTWKYLSECINNKIDQAIHYEFLKYSNISMSEKRDIIKSLL